MTKNLLKEVAKTLRRVMELRICFNGKLKMENGKLYRINWHDERLSKSANNIGATPSLIREGNTPILMTDFDDLRHDSFPDKNLTTYRPNVLTSFIKKSAFTLAEVLITLAVIGVVAAITMPTLIKSYQKKVTVERLKTAYSTLYQAIQRAEVDYGPASDWYVTLVKDASEDELYNEGKEFFEKYLKPYIKNVKEGRVDFGDNYKLYYLDGTEASYYNNRAYKVILNNGTVLSFGTRNDSSNLIEIGVFINGLKRSNIVGKDRFTLNIHWGMCNSYILGCSYNKPGTLYFYGQGNSINYLKNRNYACSKTEGTEYRGTFCGALIMQNGWKMPDDYPW